jgi:hypothetical protein
MASKAHNDYSTMLSESESSASDCEDEWCLENLETLGALATLADACTAHSRQPPKLRARLDWAEFRRLRVADGSFKRMFRMSEHQLDDLVVILTP